VDGSACDDPRLHARVSLQARAEGLACAARVPDPLPERVPDFRPGLRVADLWHYDVAECFLVGRGGRYLEVELGAGGHFLVLSFDAPRCCCDEHRALQPELAWDRSEAGWSASILLPWAIVPDGLCALDAFLCARGQYLAYHPLPGHPPDFHQPRHFPAAALAWRSDSASAR
jgi:hypothetical protein